MAVTVKDVAALAGVSPSTVSRVCKNNPSISKETREKVRRAMAKLGYEPATQANASAPKARQIGIILPPSPREVYENSFFLEVIRGISQFCNQRQYASTIVTGQDEQEILQAIRKTSSSAPHLSSDVLKTIISEVRGMEQEKKSMLYTMNILSNLTKTELAILLLLHEGKSQKEICELRCIGMSTMKSHIQNILRKFGENRIKAVIDDIDSQNLFPYLANFVS